MLFLVNEMCGELLFYFTILFRTESLQLWAITWYICVGYTKYALSFYWGQHGVKLRLMVGLIFKPVNLPLTQIMWLINFSIDASRWVLRVCQKPELTLYQIMVCRCLASSYYLNLCRHVLNHTLNNERLCIHVSHSITPKLLYIMLLKYTPINECRPFPCEVSVKYWDQDCLRVLKRPRPCDNIQQIMSTTKIHVLCASIAFPKIDYIKTNALNKWFCTPTA